MKKIVTLNGYKVGKKPTVTKLKKLLDKLFSEYIRRKDAVNDLVICITCGKKDHWKSMQNGHYIPRSHMSTRYLELNCAVQCPGCNLFKKGAMDEYAMYLIRTHGTGVLNELKTLKHTTTKWHIKDYQEKIEFYKDKLKNL